MIEKKSLFLYFYGIRILKVKTLVRSRAATSWGGGVENEISRVADRRWLLPCYYIINSWSVRSGIFTVILAVLGVRWFHLRPTVAAVRFDKPNSNLPVHSHHNHFIHSRAIKMKYFVLKIQNLKIFFILITKFYIDIYDRCVVSYEHKNKLNIFT